MVKKAGNQKELLYRSGDTTDIIATILVADAKAAPYTTDQARQLAKPTVKKTCEAIYDFVRKNITYKEDPDGLQLIQSPGHLFWGKDGKGKGEGDCKSMSIFCASILQNLGINYAYRFISQTRGADYHHVFIVVPDENGTIIVLDCVDSLFNSPATYVKVKDVVPPSCAKMAKAASIGYKKRIGAFALYDTNQDTTLGVVKNFGKVYATWDEYFFDYPNQMAQNFNIEKAMLLGKVQKDWESMMVWSIFEPISTILLGAKGNKKHKGAFEQLLDYGGFVQMMYCYWDISKAAFPANLQAKLKQAQDFKQGLLTSKINQRRTAMFKDKNKDPYLSEYTIKVITDWHCFLTYGMPLAMLLQKAYNLVNIGSEAIPYLKQPYYDLKQNKWIANGATAENMAILDKCLPYTGGNWRKFGTPYWAKGGFVMPNGVSDAAVLEFIKLNPAPAGLIRAEDITYTASNGMQYNGALDTVYYINWFTNNVLKSKYPIRSSVIDATKNDANKGRNTALTPDEQKARVTGKIGAIPLVIIIPLITAIVVFLTSLIAFIMDELNKSKSKKDIEDDLTNYPIDFKASYDTIDNCFMEATNVNGRISYTKRCPDGTVTPNADPNAPNNAPANVVTGLLGVSKSTSMIALFLLLSTGLYLLFSNSKTSKNGN